MTTFWCEFLIMKNYCIHLNLRAIFIMSVLAIFYLNPSAKRKKEIKNNKERDLEKVET